MKDSQIGVGAVLTMGVVLLGLFAVGFWFGTADLAALGVVVAAEVGAKLGMVAVTARGTATHDGLGSALAGQTDSWTIPVGLVLALPATVLTYPVPAATVAVAVALGGAFLVEGFARDRLGGINGDVLGATNEITRLGALLAGVIVWTLW